MVPVLTNENVFEPSTMIHNLILQLLLHQPNTFLTEPTFRVLTILFTAKKYKSIKAVL